METPAINTTHNAMRSHGTVPALRVRIAQAPAELEALVRLLIRRMTAASGDDLLDLLLTSLRRDLPESYAWPGNVGELEQAVRRILLTRRYDGEPPAVAVGEDTLASEITQGTLRAAALM